MKPRCYLPGAYYFITRRCTQRQFLLLPSRDTVEMFDYALGIAARFASVNIIGYCVMSNHYHLIVHDPHGTIADFTNHLNTQVARSFNAYWQRGENFWSTDAMCVVELATRADIVEKLAYTLVNPVQAGLVGKASAWEGATSWHAMVNNEPVTAKRPPIYYRRCRPKRARLDLLLTDDELGQREQFVKDVVARVGELEREVAIARSKLGLKVMTMAAVRQQSHTKTPTTCKRHELFGLRPRVAARSAWDRIPILQRNRDFVAAHAAARQRLLNGETPDFPAGTCALWQLIVAAERPTKPPKPDLNQRDATGALFFD